MTPERVFPSDPLDFIRRCVQQRKIFWTYHVNMRLKGRFISRKAILESVAGYEIIAEYPEDKYFPSYLIYSRYQDVAFHILFAIDEQGDNVRVVTAYHPDPKEWENDLKRRRQSP